MQQTVVYFCESADRAEVLSELLEFEGISLLAITDRTTLAKTIETKHPLLVIYDHKKFRNHNLSLIKEARSLGGDRMLILSVMDSENIRLKDIEELRIDSTLQPTFDFEALHCTVRRLLFPEYERWKRRDNRQIIDKSVEFSLITNEGKLPFLPSNLSMTGAHLETNEMGSQEILSNLRSDQVVRLEISSPSEPGKPLQVKAITRWLGEKSIGVEFYEFSKPNLKLLIASTAKK